MSLETVGDLVDSARVLLQDRVAPYRYETDQLVVALNTALADARRIRPDIFLPKFTVPVYSSADLAAVVNFPVFYKSALLYFMVGFAHLRDEEDTADARAAALLGKFSSELLGVTVPTSGAPTPQ
jgi:hypothetical protein